MELSPERLEVYSSLSDSGIREPYSDEYSGQQIIGYFKRFTFADGAQGLVQKGYLRSDVAREFSLSFYDNAGFSYIVNRKGDILLRTYHENTNSTFLNIFDVIELAGNSKEAFNMFQAGMAEGKRGVARFSISGQEYIFAFVSIDGTDGWSLISIIPNSIIMNEANQILNLFQIILFMVVAVVPVGCLFITMISQYRKRVKATEIEVEYREQLFSTLANNTRDVFMMLSCTDFSVVYITPNVEQVLGVSRESVMKDIRAIGKADYKDGTDVLFTDLKEIAMNSPAVFETERTQKKTGEHRWFLETIYRAMIECDERLIVIIADRTVEHKTECALQDALDIANAANSAKSTFLSNMSHDIRTPMNAILGLATLLDRDADKPDRVREHTRQIMSSGKHLLGLINDVLDMSKIESGKTTLNIGEIDLAQVIEEMTTIMRPQTKAKNQSFIVRADEVHSEYLLADQLRINQILINMLSNASKYTPDGGNIEMIIRELPQVVPNFARIQFIVSDNGIGMSQEYQKQIFQPFSREINSTTNQILGTGLGMAITKNLVELMGGTIQVKSRLGEGTTFTVDLGLRIQNQEEDKEFWRKYGITRVLVVDDEDITCRSVISIMESAGILTQYALDGRTAVEMAVAADENHEKFDLILLDWKMPGLNGLETTRQLRKILSDNVAIMILTSCDWNEIEEDCRKAGINGFLPKPFFMSNFKHAIRSLREDAIQKISTQQQDKLLEGRHFLAAEDNELNAEILVELLSMLGVTCEIAKNGQEAVKMFEASEPGHFDLVLMDVQMPIMNGYDATRAIRASEHALAKTIPIVAMTANAFADDINNAMNAGMNAHLSKPVELDLMEKVLSNLLNNCSE